MHQTGKTVSQEGLPKQAVMLEECWGPASSLDIVPKVVFFFLILVPHIIVLFRNKGTIAEHQGLSRKNLDFKSLYSSSEREINGFPVGASLFPLILSL